MFEFSPMLFIHRKVEWRDLFIKIEDQYHSFHWLHNFVNPNIEVYIYVFIPKIK